MGAGENESIVAAAGEAERAALTPHGTIALRERVGAFFARAGAEAAGGVLVGCSGGADSTALALLLSERRLPLTLVYVDHGLRSGTDAEAEVVRSLAESIGAGYALARVSVSQRGNLQANARQARYGALAAEARVRGLRVIAVGHTASDQIETVAFRLERGASAHALAGMPEQRSLDGDLVLIRPILSISRAQAEDYLRAHGRAFVSDPSNLRMDFARVRIRTALALAPGEQRRLHELVVDSAETLARDDAEAASLGDPGSLSIHLLASVRSGVLLRLLRRCGLHRAGAAHVSALQRLASSSRGSRSIDLGGGLAARRTYDRIALVDAPAERSAAGPAASIVRVQPPGRFRIGDREIEVSIVDGTDRRRDDLSIVLLARPMVLRTFRRGDRLRSSQGRRKLQDVLTDRKVPRRLRADLALLALDDEEGCAPDGEGSQGEVLWIDGVGSASAWLSARDERALRVTSQPCAVGQPASRDDPRG